MAVRWLISISLITALLLSVVPIPFEWREWRPEFVALLVIYWATYSPEYFGVFSAWLCGILLDVVSLTVLGQHALGLVIIAYIANLAYQRIRSYAIWQQSAWALVLIGVYQLFTNWTSGLVGKSIDAIDFLGAAAFTAAFWPLLVIVLRKIKIHFRLP